MTTVVDQKAYLQKYLGGPSKEKKKKKKKAIKGKGLKIVDDDIDLSKLRPLDDDELDILGQGEDAPQVVGIIEERPEELFKKKWRVINQDDGFNSELQIEEVNRDVKEVEKENEIIFGKMYSDSEDEKGKNDSDISPPRKNSSKKHNNDSDFSPPRKRDQTNKEKEEMQQRKEEVRKERSRKPSRWGDADPETTTSSSPKRNKSNRNRSESSDLSPPRKKKNYDSDLSPERKRRTSPQRRERKKRSESSDLSPPRKNRRKSQSPVRKSKNSPERYIKGNREPSRRDKDKRSMSERDKTDIKNKRSKQNSDSDLSPVRERDRNGTERNRNMSEKDRAIQRDKRRSRSPKKKSKDSDSDLSPPRKRDKNIVKDKKHSRKSASPKKKRKQDSDSDLSPPRKERDRITSDRDRNTSDRARNTSDRDRNKQRRFSDSPPPTNKKMAKTLEGKNAGLQDARQLRKENEEFRKKEDEVFKKLGDDISGRTAQAVSRKGKRDTSEDRQKQKEKAERQKELDAKYKMWSKGVKQVEAQEARIQDYIHEASKPVARHRDDKDLEHSLKQIERAGDPMLDYMRDRKRERGELPPEKPSYKGNFPPNRFNIRPGYRWDGVDRSNGYENKYFQQISKKKAQEEEAYKWASEDL